MKIKRLTILPVIVAAVISAAGVFGQSGVKAPRTILLDHNGAEISNNEFVDIRMANFHYPDATITRTLNDGTIEFRLQRIPQEGEKAPKIVFRTLGGEKLDLSSLAGKVVVLNFWFIGCASCLAHQPKLNVLKSEFGGERDVVFLAATADPAGDVKKYLTKQRFEYTQIADAEEQLKAFRFSGYPRNIVISKTGEIVYWRTTIAAWDKFESAIRLELSK